MKTIPNLRTFTPAISFAAVLAMLLWGVGCEQKPAPPGPRQPPQARATTPAEKTSFQEVTSQLDPGGTIYVYLSTRQWLDGLAGRVGEWRDLVAALPDISANDRPNVMGGFDLATRLIRESGIEAIDGVGFSGVAVEKGLYRSKFVVHRAANSPQTGLWSVFGKKPRPLYELDYLPADTVWAVAADLDAAAMWNGIAGAVAQSGIPGAKQALDQMDAGIQQAAGSTMSQLLASTGGEGGAVLTFSDTRKIQVPLGPAGTFQIPEPALAIFIKVKDDTLFNQVERQLANNPQTVRSDDAGLRMRTLPVPLPLPVPFRPTIARHGDHLFIASTDELVRAMIAVKAGSKPGLKSTGEFARLSKGLPTEGNSFNFVSQRLGATVQEVQAAALTQSTGAASPGPAALFRKLSALSPPVSTFAVSRATPEGWLTVGQGNQEPANAILVPVAVAPVAILAGMTLPALAKAKEKAQSISCMNNLKQIGLAARIYATDHDGRFPPDYLAMRNELTTPRVLICPKAPNAGNAASLNWDAFDASETTYEYVSKGLQESSAGIAGKVLFRCRIHRHECMGDGSVRSGSSR